MHSPGSVSLTVSSLWGFYSLETHVSNGRAFSSEPSGLPSDSSDCSIPLPVSLRNCWAQAELSNTTMPQSSSQESCPVPKLAGIHQKQSVVQGSLVWARLNALWTSLVQVPQTMLLKTFRVGSTAWASKLGLSAGQLPSCNHSLTQYP